MRSGSTPTTATDPALNGPSSGQVMALWEDYKRRKASTPKERSDMALTRDFKETVAARVQNDPAFAQALLDEAITLFVNGEPESAKLILRDLVNATVGFEALAHEIHKPAKSLHWMLSKSGNPTMSNVSAIFAAIKRALKVEVRAQVVMA
jgi:DNA-binding phage protein